MLQVRANPARLLVSKCRPLKRTYGTAFQPLRPRIRLLGPTLWSLAACSTIYVGCAAYEVFRDAQHAREKGSRWAREKSAPAFEDLQGLRDRVNANAASVRRTGSLPERPEFTAPENVTMGTMALTLAVHAASALGPSMSHHFAHIPALSGNYTLLTSVFGHAGWLHLGLNLYGMFMLMPSAALTPTLEGSGAHLAAFFASAGILSSLANHATAVWPGRTAFAASLGASGALFALLGVVGVSFPNTQVGIIFLPGSIPIGDAMVYIALFDAIGIFVRYPFLHLGHAAHLGGLLLGVAYARRNGGENIWRPTRRIAFTAMRSLGVI